MKKFYLPILVLLVIVVLTSCQVNSFAGQNKSNQKNNDSSQDPNVSDDGEKVYVTYQEAYQEVILGLQKKQNEILPIGDPSRVCLYDVDKNGQDELICVYVGEIDTLYFAMWTFDEEKLVLLMDNELASMRGIGTGGVNIVEYEGTQYICGWAYDSAPWEPGEANIYYDCILWEYPSSSSYAEAPFSWPAYTFNFRYYMNENGDIRSDAFSFLEDGHIALPISKFEELKDILLDNPVQVLCEADIIHSVGFSFDDMLDSLRSLP